MSRSTSANDDSLRDRQVRPHLSWPAVIGFGALGLLWPLLRLVGLDAVIGGLPTALIAFVTASAVWVLGAGWGDVPRPVLTLTMSGVLFGVLQVASSLLMGEWPDYGPGLAVAAGAIEVARAAGFGALAGLAAGAIQRERRRRR